MTGLLDRYDGFAIDLDGVVWRGEAFIPGALEALRMIRDAGKRLLLLTNNASYSPGSVSRRLETAGMAVSTDEVITTLSVAKDWIVRESLQAAKAILVVPPIVKEQLLDTVQSVDDPDGVQLVLVARDTGFDFDKLTRASASIRAGARFVAVNNDPVLPAEGQLLPGTGAIVAAIRAASGTEPIVLGKPERPMMELALKALGPERVLMIGDRLGSDIAGGRSVGWDTALVLTGVTDATDRLDPKPDHVVASLLEVTRI